MGSLAFKAITKKGKEFFNNVPNDFFSLSAPDIDGKLTEFSSFNLQSQPSAGKKAFLVVNVACD